MSLHVKKTSYTLVTINNIMQTHFNQTAVKSSKPSELGSHGKKEKEKLQASLLFLQMA